MTKENYVLIGLCLIILIYLVITPYKAKEFEKAILPLGFMIIFYHLFGLIKMSAIVVIYIFIKEIKRSDW